ncbi:MAG: SDR family NAD(P)-dependent oxidoreductase [Pseudomonadota bacterium]
MTILVTGAAGFIGFHLCQALLGQGEKVLGVDSLNDYYDPALKEGRLALLQGRDNFAFVKLELSDREDVMAVAEANPEVTRVVHLAAQAGVRYSLENPYAYVDANVMGQVVLMEAARRWEKLDHFVYASSSSVYGGNKKIPFAVGDPVENPVSLYAATKRSVELMSTTYAGLYGLPLTGLRFFTVYGPWGRPDMAYFSFTKDIFEGRQIRVFNHGDMRRDFTYIDDIVAGIQAVMKRPPVATEGQVPHNIYNLGNHRSETLGHFIEVLEGACGREAVKKYEPMQLGDVHETYADIDSSRRDFGFEPKISIEEGLPRFVDWYKGHYGV